MELFIQHATGALYLVGSMALVFGALAMVTKRGQIWTAWLSVRREFTTNLTLAAVNLLLVAPLVAVPIAAFHGLIAAPAALVTLWSGLPGFLVLILTLLCAELVVYWRHRLEHHPLLWRFHATHHADTRYHWLTVLRKHPVSALLSRLVDALLLLALGFPVWAVAAVGLLTSFWGFFIHADVPWTLGRAGRWLISPAAHRLHHIREEALMGANFGNTLTLWDRVFGTYVDPAPHVRCETGIAEGTRGIMGELLRPWERRYRRRGQLEVAETLVGAEASS